MAEKFVWIFHGLGARFASGVFESEELAINWIKNNKLQGVLTKYPLNIGVYDWVVKNNLFEPKKDSERLPEFIQKFTSAAQEHVHFEDD